MSDDINDWRDSNSKKTTAMECGNQF